MENKKLRIGINAKINPSEAGGIAPFIAGLVKGLGKLDDGDEEYLIVTHPRHPNWLDSFLGKNQKVISSEATILDNFIKILEPAKNYLRPLMELNLMFKSFKTPVAASESFWDSLEVDVIHFPYQLMDITKKPSIFNPHDLQHIHHPDFFGFGSLAWRNKYMKAWCESATFVSAESHFGKEDIIEHLNINPDKVCVVYRGAPTDLYENLNSSDLNEISKKFSLPENFIFYPAQIWPHKNHLKLLRAIALLRDNHHIKLNLVCVGKKRNFWKTVNKEIDLLKLNNQAFFFGYVSNTELKALYKLCDAVVFPTLFEGGGFPLLEAFRQGKPIACSDIPPLKEVGEGAAVFFNPNNPESIAQALINIITPKTKDLIDEAKKRMSLFDWEQTAKSYRSLYRLVAKRTLQNEDNEIIESIFASQKHFVI